MRSESKTRDAERSRDSILDAAEELFSKRGFHGTSLADIGSASGLSRATPTYFFGSKEKLYVAVLERVFAARQSETEQAVRPILSWCESGDQDPGELKTALSGGMDRYMSFLLDRPSFGRLIYWEELDGARRLDVAERRSTALTDAFTAVQGALRSRRGSEFVVREAVVLWVSIGFLAATLPETFMSSQGMDVRKPTDRRRHADLGSNQLMALIYPDA